MNTKLLQIVTTIYLLVGGVLFSFLPDEVIAHLRLDSNIFFSLSLQLIGALYLGFAALNWLKRDTLIGGIYSRPLVFANLMHFSVGFFAIAKIATLKNDFFNELLILSILYFMFSVSYAYLIFAHPKKANLPN